MFCWLNASASVGADATASPHNSKFQSKKPFNLLKSNPLKMYPKSSDTHLKGKMCIDKEIFPVVPSFGTFQNQFRSKNRHSIDYISLH